MTLTRRVGYGVTIGVDPTGGTSYTVLGAVVEGFKRSGVKIDTANVTILSDFWQKFVQCGGNPGTLGFTIAYDPTDATTTTVLTGLLDGGNCDASWQITFPAVCSGSGSGAVESFKGILVGFEQEGMKDKLVIGTIEVQVSGSPGYTGV